ncbi:uncharacterized protein TrAtP1_002577 [Trichoderma atroviride]|uniref:uncharacterized protein n=1 Tax=Hypocrea atroviridis TaxID=63577 RepID=UPI00332CB99A|nr:hypothetical protein TrAtP1_002577 [Trichoderma atroviride]
MVDVNTLQKIPASQNTFDDLKIDQSHKRLVKSLVKTHFQAQNIRKQQQPRARLNQDLIRGKGSGLVILLHGVPGVGKTATAEAVSVANGKPLFTITCGDLGFTPKEVEESLMEIFRLAHTWDCVLLLDEADVFLARREVSDLNRNALVSVFLRVLEYYSGILFLTTNRVGTLDEAFKSRIHVSLYYPPLGKRQTLAIFDVNIRKLTNIENDKEKFQHDGDVKSSKRPTLEIDRDSILAFAASHFDRNEPSERWNGRQIRNAFQIAYSLAQFDMQEASMKHLDEDHADASVKGENTDDGLHLTPFTLNYKQFKEVANAVKRFDAYLHEAIGSDMDQSYTSGLRNDYHDPSHPSNKFVYNPPTPQAQRQNYSTRHDGSQKNSDRVYRERSEDYDSTGNGYANSAPRRQRNTDRDSSQGYSQRPPSGAYQPSQQYSPPRNPGRKPQGQGAPSQQGKAQYLKQNPSPHVHTQPRSPMRQHESENFTHDMDNKDYDNDEEYEEYGNNEYSYNQEYSDHEESYADGRY